MTASPPGDGHAVESPDAAAPASPVSEGPPLAGPSREVWGRVAAVLRTLHWVRSDEARLGEARYVGATSARLLAAALDLAAPEERGPSEQALVLLQGFAEVLRCMARYDPRSDSWKTCKKMYINFN